MNNKPEQIKILIVDDEDALRFSLASILELEGYQVKSAATGFEAVDIASKEYFDILISDIRMPGMTGTETFQHIRKAQPNIIGIMMTAYALNDLITEALNAGAFACLSKPFEVETVLATIDDVISRPFAVVIDDDEKLNKAFLTYLKNSGLNVASVKKDTEKISFMLKHKPDIVVFAINGNFDLSKSIIDKLQALIENVPKIIFVYEKSETEYIQQLKRFKTAHFIERPVTVKDVFKIIDKSKRKLNVAMINMNSDEFTDLKTNLSKKGFHSFEYDSAKEFFDEINNSFFDTVVINTAIGKNILEFHEQFAKESPGTGVVYVLNSQSDIETVSQKGFFYAVKPLELNKFVDLIRKITATA